MRHLGRMADEPTQAQAAESTTEATENTAAETITSTQEEQSPSLENLSLDDLDALADQIGKDAEPQPEPPKAEEPPKEETKAEESEEDAEQAEDAEAKAPKRVRLTALQDQERALVSTAIQMVNDGLAANFTEAYARLTAKPDAPQVEAEAEQQQEAEPPITERIKSEIAQIRTALKEAKDAFDGEKEMDLLEALADAKAELRLEEFKAQQAELQQQTEAQSAFETAYAEARNRANELYPDGADPESDFAKGIAAVMDDLSRTTPAIFDSPNYPLAVAGLVAAKLGIAPATAKASPAKQQQAKTNQSVPVPKVAARPASPAVGGNATSVQNAASIQALLDNLSAEDLDALAAQALG